MSRFAASNVCRSLALGAVLMIGTGAVHHSTPALEASSAATDESYIQEHVF